MFYNPRFVRETVEEWGVPLGPISGTGAELTYETLKDKSTEEIRSMVEKNARKYGILDGINWFFNVPRRIDFAAGLKALRERELSNRVE